MTVIEEARRAMASGPPVKVPQHHDRVYKDECMFSYDTSLSPGGLYISLSSWQAFGEKFVAMDHKRSNNLLYLHEKAFKVPIPQESKDTAQAPDRLAIGGQGGFQVDEPKFTIERETALFVYPNTRIPLPNTELPELILQSITSIIAHQGQSLQDETAAWEEDRPESKFAADLEQLQEGMGQYGRRIPSDPSKWRCDETGVTENLWLNLSTGFIGSGRQNWDGSGGNGAAVRHFEATGKKYPLAVKLGTITPHAADVFSYAEDDMVTDAKLAEHLTHWGINMMDLEKTEKTMAELQINLNMSYEFDKITESGSHLQPLSGPGYVGLKNLGNSCYMNSILQLLWTVPNVQQRYLPSAEQIFNTAPENPALDLNSQMAKVGRALCLAETGGPENILPDTNCSSQNQQNGSSAANTPDQLSVRPQSFKTLVGKGHTEFSSGRQQDASEYFQFLLDLIAKSEKISEGRLGDAANVKPTASAFHFATETRIQCQESQRVSYKRDPATNVMSISIPMNAAVNKDDVQLYEERQAKRAKLKESNAEAYISQDGAGNGTVTATEQEEKILPRVPLNACLHRWQASEQIEYFSAALGRKGLASKQTRLASFPPYLMLQLNRFFLADDWTSRKLEVLVDIPTSLDLEPLRSRGLQPGELEQPAEPDNAASAKASETLQPDPSIVESLKQMGFSENGSKRAAVATKNGSTEAAMEWVLGHMEDPDFNDPIQAPASQDQSTFSANADSVAMLSGMGFTDRQATAALKACQGSLERAADWLFSRASDLDSHVNEVLSEPKAQPTLGQGNASASQQLEDGPGKYKLLGFVSHMGANTACGHYVCHMFKEGRWVIYNDDKVAVSENPPIDLGYLYLFKREDVA